MAQWQRQLNLLPEWKQYPDEIGTKELALVVSKKLEKLAPFNIHDIDEKKEELVAEFKDLGEYGGDIELFDELMNELYDWGDISLDGKWNGKKVCWIKTF